MAPARAPGTLEASMWERVLEQSPDAAGRETDDGAAIVVTSQDGTLHALNATGAAIWRAADGERSLAEIARVLQARFDVDDETVRREAERFAGEAVERGLLRVRDG
jgi:outer membrane protein assembly factor BamB